VPSASGKMAIAHAQRWSMRVICLNLFTPPDIYATCRRHVCWPFRHATPDYSPLLDATSSRHQKHRPIRRPPRATPDARASFAAAARAPPSAALNAARLSCHTRHHDDAGTPLLPTTSGAVSSRSPPPSFSAAEEKPCVPEVPYSMRCGAQSRKASFATTPADVVFPAHLPH